MGYVCVRYSEYGATTSVVPFRWLAILLVWTVGKLRGGRMKVIHCSGVVVYERGFL